MIKILLFVVLVGYLVVTFDSYFIRKKQRKLAEARERNKQRIREIEETLKARQRK